MTGEEDLRIPASPEDVARSIMEGPPADDWDYLQPGGGDDPEAEGARPSDPFAGLREYHRAPRGDDPDPEADQPAPPEKQKDPGPERGM